MIEDNNKNFPVYFIPSSGRGDSKSIKSTIYEEQNPEIFHLDQLEDNKIDYNMAESICQEIFDSLLKFNYVFKISRTNGGYFFIKIDYPFTTINISEICLALKKFSCILSIEADFFGKEPNLQIRVKNNDYNNDIKINYGKFKNEVDIKFPDIKFLKKLGFTSLTRFEQLMTHLYIHLVPLNIKPTKYYYNFKVEQEDNEVCIYLQNCITLTNNLKLINKIVKEYELFAINKGYTFNEADLYIDLKKKNIKIALKHRTKKRKKRKRNDDSKTDFENDSKKRKLKK
jgi:hypothetical protein